MIDLASLTRVQCQYELRSKWRRVTKYMAQSRQHWLRTAGPLPRIHLSADLGAERVLAAEQGSKRIVVEVKSFLGPSPVHELQQALGQHEMYRYCLKALGSDRLLFLAISADVHADFFQTEAVMELVADAKLRLLIVNLEKEEVTQWIE